jgi:hypothetical protein
MVNMTTANASGPSKTALAAACAPDHPCGCILTSPARLSKPPWTALRLAESRGSGLPQRAGTQPSPRVQDGRRRRLAAGVTVRKRLFSS